jgi:hypothetical protein
MRDGGHRITIMGPRPGKRAPGAGPHKTWILAPDPCPLIYPGTKARTTLSPDPSQEVTVERQIERMVALENPRSPHREHDRVWCMVEGGWWYKCDWEYTPYEEPFPVPEDDPGMTYDELLAMAEREGLGVEEIKQWNAEERAYEFMASFRGHLPRGLSEVTGPPRGRRAPGPRAARGSGSGLVDQDPGDRFGMPENAFEAARESHGADNPFIRMGMYVPTRGGVLATG